MSVTNITKQRCIAISKKDGQQCGRRVPPASTSAYCHIHARVAAGLPAHDHLFEVLVPFDPVEKMRKIAANDSHPQQLQALKQLLDLTTDCAKCQREAQRHADNDFAIARMTDAQRARVNDLTREVRSIVEEARTQAINPQQEHTNGTERQHERPTRTSTAVSAAPREHAPDRVAEARAEPEVAPPYVVPRDLYDELGLVDMNGTITHAFGDDYAQNILDGSVSVEDARAQHQETQRKLDRMEAPRRV